MKQNILGIFEYFERPRLDRAGLNVMSAETTYNNRILFYATSALELLTLPPGAESWTTKLEIFAHEEKIFFLHIFFSLTRIFFSNFLISIFAHNGVYLQRVFPTLCKCNSKLQAKYAKIHQS